MGVARRTETEHSRRDQGTTRDEEPDTDAFVIWGRGAEPPDIDDEFEPSIDPSDLAETIAEELDPDWWDQPSDERWVVIVRGDQDEIDELARELGVSGPAPYTGPS